MSNASKFRILIADDDPNSAKVIMAHALAVADSINVSGERKSAARADLPTITDDKRIDLAKTVLDFICFETVSETLDFLKKVETRNEPAFHIAFVDMNFQKSESREERKGLSKVDVRGIDVIREIKQSHPSIKIMIHSKYSGNDEIINLLAASGFGIQDTITLLEGVDTIIPHGDRLKRVFPELIRSAAKAVYLANSQTESTKGILDVNLDDFEDKEIVPQMSSFSKDTLLVGWKEIGIDVNQNICLKWHTDVNQAKYELKEWRDRPDMKIGGILARDPSTQNIAYNRLNKYRQIDKSNKEAILRNQTINAVMNFINLGWGAINLNIPDGTNRDEHWRKIKDPGIFNNDRRVKLTFLEGVLQDLTIVKNNNAKEEDYNVKIKNILLSRRILITLDKLNRKGHYFNQMGLIFDIAVSIIFNNNPYEAQAHIREFILYDDREIDANLKRVFFTILGLSGSLSRSNPYINRDNLLEEELDWLNSDEFKTLQNNNHL
jgi:CheY-like chemotaxis protein